MAAIDFIATPRGNLGGGRLRRMHTRAGMEFSRMAARGQAVMPVPSLMGTPFSRIKAGSFPFQTVVVSFA